MLRTDISANEFVEYATFLFGGQWRDEIASKLDLPRKSIVLMLASGEPVPEDLAVSLVQLLDDRLVEMEREQAALRTRISVLRGGRRPSSSLPTTSWGHMQHAC